MQINEEKKNFSDFIPSSVMKLSPPTLHQFFPFLHTISFKNNVTPGEMVLFVKFLATVFLSVSVSACVTEYSVLISIW